MIKLNNMTETNTKRKKQGPIIAKISTVEFVREDSSDHGPLKVFNYEMVGWPGKVQARHVDKSITKGTKAMFTWRHNNDFDIPCGSMKITALPVSALPVVEKSNGPKLSNIKSGVAAKVAALNAATTTYGIRDKEHVIEVAEYYLKWLKNK